MGDDEFLNEVFFGGNKIHPEKNMMKIQFVLEGEYDI